MTLSGHNILPAPRPRLPKVSRKMAELWARMGELELEGSVELASTTVAYAAQTVPLAKQGTGTRVDVKFGDMELTVCVTLDLLDWVPTGVDTSSLVELDPMRLAMLLEHTLTSDFQRLEEQGQSKIEIQAVYPNSRFLTAEAVCCLTLHEDETRIGLAFLMAQNTEALADRLETAFAKRSRRTLRDRSVEVTVLGPIFEMSRQEVRSLGPGDVFFPDDGWERPDSICHLLVANTHLVALRTEGDGYSIEGPEDTFVSALTSQTQDGTMAQNDPRKGSLADPSTVVTIELDRQMMPLSQVEALQAGGIVELNISTVERVVMCANGEPVAEGRLVELDGIIGVQLTRLV